MFFIRVKHEDKGKLIQEGGLTVKINGKPEVLRLYSESGENGKDYLTYDGQKCEILVAQDDPLTGDIDFTCASHGQSAKDCTIIDPLAMLMDEVAP